MDSPSLVPAEGFDMDLATDEADNRMPEERADM